MKHLVQLIDNEFRVSTLDLAEALGVQNSTLTKLVKRYRTEFEEFGQVGFKIRVGKRISVGIELATLRVA